jgi:hypothetical protein
MEEKMPKPISAALVCAALIPLAAAPALADSVTWEAFARSPGGLAAIAMGIDMVGTCSQPLQFSQEAEGDSVRVRISCDSPDDETDVFLTFDRLGESLFLRKVDIAG